MSRRCSAAISSLQPRGKPAQLDKAFPQLQVGGLHREQLVLQALHAISTLEPRTLAQTGDLREWRRE